MGLEVKCGIAKTSYVAVHKEFDRDHKIITTVVSGNGGSGKSFDSCLSWCMDANKKGFNYKPYLRTKNNIY